MTIQTTEVSKSTTPVNKPTLLGFNEAGGDGAVFLTPNGDLGDGQGGTPTTEILGQNRGGGTGGNPTGEQPTCEGREDTGSEPGTPPTLIGSVSCGIPGGTGGGTMTGRTITTHETTGSGGTDFETITTTATPT